MHLAFAFIRTNHEDDINRLKIINKCNKMEYLICHLISIDLICYMRYVS